MYDILTSYTAAMYVQSQWRMKKRGGSEDRWGAGGESVGEDEEAKCGLRPAFPTIPIITV